MSSDNSLIIPIKHRAIKRLISGTKNQNNRITFEYWDSCIDYIIEAYHEGSVHAKWTLYSLEQSIDISKQKICDARKWAEGVLDINIEELRPKCVDDDKNWILQEDSEKINTHKTTKGTIYSEKLQELLKIADEQLSYVSTIEVLAGPDSIKAQQIIDEWFMQTRSAVMINPVRVYEVLKKIKIKYGGLLPTAQSYKQLLGQSKQEQMDPIVQYLEDAMERVPEIIMSEKTKVSVDA